jgi:hypothetical protein
MELSPSWEPASRSVSQELPPKYFRSRSFITVFRRDRHWSLSWARWIQSIPLHPISLRSILLSSSHLRQCHPSCLFLSRFPTKILYAFIFSIMRATCRANHIFLNLLILIILGEEYKLRSSSLCSFLQPPVTSSLFGPNILLSALFSNTLSLCSSRNVRDQVLLPYKTTCKIITVWLIFFCCGVFLSVLCGAVVPRGWQQPSVSIMCRN